MQPRRSFLIDTNIVIQLEDGKPIPAQLAALQRTCSKFNVRLLVHEISRSDIQRDGQPTRRAATLSKLSKFEMLSGIPQPSDASLVNRFGKIASDNDRCDALLLHAVDRNAADFLVTEDMGIHRRARLAGLADRVYRVQDALEWLRQNYEPKTVTLPYLVEKHCYELELSDPIFATLREGYPEFDEWFQTPRVQQRLCWILKIDSATAGIVIRKDDEQPHETDALTPAAKILKIATFKVAERYRGEKFGEHLLKQVLWHAQRNRYDLVYLTAFEDEQVILVDLLKQFGFNKTGTTKRGEAILEKRLGFGQVTDTGEPVLALARVNYPRFVESARVALYAIPIQPRWYHQLFPENDARPALLDWSPNRTPGNTIRKVYLCRSQVKCIEPGSILLFYISGSEIESGTVRTVGVVESYREVCTADDLLRATGRRSVYTENEQLQMIESDSRPVKVIDFLLTGHLTMPLTLSDLRRIGSLRAAPQSITRLSIASRRDLNLHELLGYQ